MVIKRRFFWLGVGGILWGALGDAGAQILSSKRGFADTSANYNDLQASGAGWYYTWGTGAASPGNFDANFYPMIWNGTPSQSTLTSIVNRNPNYVLGFNEPERPDQANMTVSQAISSWTTISSALSGTSIKLVSPAVADTGGTTGGQAWLSSFMSTAKTDGLKVDAVAFHWYGVSTPTDPAGAASSFLSRVDSYHNSYGLPVFITEFAIHDWGGVYSDAQIIEANREFLNIVIPGLESRSYVAGYSWYNWFSDDPLYTTSGSTLTPTQMGYNYIGSLGVGTTTNIGGQNLGEHVAELTGGQLTMTGATAGTIKYINALSGESSVAGTMDWGLSGTNNWVRIQPGARLTKTGTDQITFNNGTIANNGVLEVSQGTLVLGSTVSGSGVARVSGGALVLTGAGPLNSTPLIDVRPGATLNFSGLTSGAINIGTGRTLNNDGSGIGNVIAATGSTISGGGAFTGNVTAQSGATVQVGKDGSGVASRVSIDNFESYARSAPGPVVTAAPPWTAHQGTTDADIENLSGNFVLSFGSTSVPVGVSRSLPSAAVLDNNSTATYFFRVNSNTDTPNHNVGLGDQASTQTVDFADFEAQLRLKQGTTAGTFAVDARNGGAFSSTLASGLTLNTWYNIWMVINQATDKYDLYMNTGTNSASAGNKLNSSQLSFRNGTNQDLDTFLALASPVPIANGVSIDDLIYQSGVDLTNPMAGFNAGLTWTPQTLSVNGNYTQNPGAVLQMNLSDPNKHDLLNVTGTAALGGTLNVTFATGAAAPKIGDAFHLVNATSITGSFSTLQLPALTGTLAWDSSQLSKTGSISIFSDLLGDYSQDGKLDMTDVDDIQLALQDLSGFESAHGLSDFSLNLFGDVNGDGQITSADVQALQNLVFVPEPGSLMMVGVGVLTYLTRRRSRVERF